MVNIENNLIETLNTLGYKSSIISIEHLKEIQADIKNTINQNSDVNKNLSKYLNRFNYELPEAISAKSVIIIAVPQPIARIHFTIDGKKHSVIMPPTYLMNTSVESEGKQKLIVEVNAAIDTILSAQGYKAVKTNLPGKLLGVKSGLGSYGKNNIFYINNGGSFYWIGVYLSDMPCEHDSWCESTVMDHCHNCDLCMKKCPTGAIADDRFLVHVDKCITFMNESNDNFPEWLDTRWHNSIIGCMHCQMICPANKDSIKNVEDLAEFDQNETELILANYPLKDLPRHTLEKLEAFNFTEDYDLLARNLKVLISKI